MVVVRSKWSHECGIHNQDYLMSSINVCVCIDIYYCIDIYN